MATFKVGDVVQDVATGHVGMITEALGIFVP